MGIPNNLGSGSRKPGMEPYLTFIVNEIFLKFNTRNYKNTIEKWQIAEKCLKILRYLLEIYEIHNQDLVKNKRDQLPGYHIMLQLHTKSEMLHLILLIIDETRLKLDEYTKFNEKNDLEECGLHCLKILKLGLEKQDSFFEYHSTTNNTILLSGLKNILLDVNPRSGNPDHILNTTKFVTYNWLPKHRYNAIKILKIISKQPKVTHQILDMLTENIQIQTEIRNGFMECLEHDITLPLQYSEMESISANQALKKELELKESVIDFLQEGLYQPAPNLTHFLLGFDTSKDFNQTQKMRVIDVSCNCLKSIISLLDNYLEVQDKAYDNNFERFIERCYYFIYSLCANQKTSETILRYLRSCGDFMSRHICAFPFSYMKEPHILRQMSYVLKCIAIELKVTSSNCQISRFQYLCELLVSTDKNGYHNNIPMDINNLCPQSSNLLTDKFICKQQSEKSLNLILCNLLDMISFEVVNHSIPRLEFFDGSLISQILHDCEIENEEGLKQISIKKLDQLLHDELRTVQTTIATGQRKHILNEIKVLLYFALQINNGRCKSFATIKFIEAWCQVTEILFSCAPELALSINTKQELILEILQKLLSKIVPIQPIFEVSILTSGTMLLLLVNLRYNYQTLRRIVAEKDNTPKNRLDTLEDEHKTMSTKSNSLSLKFILKNILEWIIISGGASQKLRINLYASLLNYLRIIKGCHNRNSKEDITNEIYILGLDKSIVKDVPHNESALIQLTVEIFLSFGEKLIDIICSDCITGHDICKMTALSCIDGLLELGSMSDFITFFAKRGYLAHLIESLLKSDDNLCLVLKKSPKNIKSLYVYESKMSMLLRLASCHMGAELLLTEKVLHVLSNMKVYDMYPDFQNRNDLMEDNDLNDFIPSIDMRYRHILFPALNFCECIISTLGKKNHSAISQVTHFLLAHCGMVETVLRSGTPFMQLEPLQEYAAITGLVARTINQNIFSLSEIHATEHSDINLYRTHKLMLSSLSQFLVNENTFKEMLRLQYIKGPINDATKDKYIKTFFEIAANLSLFCCNAISDHSTDRRINGIMFLETIQSNDNLNNSNKIIHYLNVIIDQLKSSVEFVYNQNYTADNLLCQKAVPQDINGDELVTHKYVKSFFNMNQCLCTTRDALSLCVFVTEQCLYLLWSHLDFYVRKTFSNDFEHKLLLDMCNLQVEIEQNECRLEIYPLTQSILDLLYTLIKMGIPNNLGSGSRKPGMEPYLTFIVNEIFLKFNTRNYKNTIEKWQIAEKCLKILRYLLEIYEIHNQDLVKNKTDQLPGYHIMLQLHTKSEMLHLILLIIDETRLKLDEYTKFNEKNDLEECGLHCLKILKLGLEKQDSFFEYHSTTNNTILLSGLKNILLDVNPRSGNPDHILNTTKFVTYNWLPKHRYNAIKILKIISKQPKVTHQILDMLTENIQIQTEIRNGFMECLEHDITLPLQYSEMESISANQALKKELELKESVIDFLQEGLYQPAPNLTHFLLGFDTSKDFNQTQKMRVIDVSCNCLKSIISLLDNYLEVQDKAYDNNFERFIERCYYFIYSLCANQKTSETILRYLRSCGDFMSRHICAFPFSYMKEPHILRQMSYVLKCIAIELKVTSSNCQISRFQYLCELLVSTDKNGYHNNIPMDINNLCPQSSNLLTDKFICKQQSEKSLNLILCNLLDMISFEVVNHSIPRLEFFDGSLISQILHDCEIENEEGLKQISIKKLDQLLHDELRTVQTTIATGQRKHILNEIKVLLYFALQINNGRCKSFATIKFIEAWCQVTEILFSCAPELALSINTKQELILEILQKLLSKIVPIQPIFEVSILTSGTMLLLLVNLRYNYQTLRRIVAEKDNTPKNRLDTLEDEHKTMSTKSNSLSLKFILKNILEWIIISGGASQKLRINLYASLLNYLRIIKGCHNRNSKEDITNEIYILGLDKSIVKDVPHNESALIQLTVEIFLSFGEKLIDIICSDCITGHDICKMTALSCIDGLLELGSMSDFITFFAKRGYLAHLIESLLKSDDNLCLVLKKSPKNIKSLYVYESKMSMLLRLASCHMGAELLLTEKVLHVLSNMKVYDMYPDFQNRNDLMEDNDLNDFIPSIDMRYRHILFPALNFCECIISTLGKKNHSAISQVTHFLLAHCGMVETVLRSGTPFMQLEPLQEYAAITGLVARTINQNIFSLSEIHATEHSDINLYRTHKLMLSSLSQFLVNENTFKEMLRLQYIKGPINDATKDKYIKTFFEIAANLSLFCCNAISDHSTDRRINGIMFLETIQSNDNLNNSNKIIHYLNVIIDQLKSSVEFVYNQNYTADNLLCQKAVPQDINGDELVTHKYVKSFFNMNQCLCTTRDALSLCVFVTEQCLYLLWSHLDFYVRKTFSNDFEHKLLLVNEVTNIQGKAIEVLPTTQSDITNYVKFQNITAVLFTSCHKHLRLSFIQQTLFEMECSSGIALYLAGKPKSNTL
ncbi:uncharacterized protein LOC119685527 [Teleopsis dalmanni]|uniref:uncharacterized protein LOC119685527 n=1 Tax=Teleopsis dalmanni TaxID=139649 RepID=UPI0018CF3B76|nr:uncharacterized protein LOC119685527 [Teleopsis dalmanni]